MISLQCTFVSKNHKKQLALLSLHPCLLRLLSSDQDNSDFYFKTGVTYFIAAFQFVHYCSTYEAFIKKSPKKDENKNAPSKLVSTHCGSWCTTDEISHHCWLPIVPFNHVQGLLRSPIFKDSSSKYISGRWPFFPFKMLKQNYFK